MKPGASFNRASPANRAHVNSPLDCIFVKYYFRHTALLWTSPTTELDVNNLAMKWKKTLTTHGCDSFFDRGQNFKNFLNFQEEQP